MPHTLAYRPTLVDVISSDRLSSYAAVFNPPNDIALVGVYVWNSHACAAIYPLLCAVEVALRNSIDLPATQFMGTFWWTSKALRYKSFTPNAKPPDAVRKLKDNFAKAYTSVIREKNLRYGPGAGPTHQDVVAKTDFSTWEYLLDAEFRGNGLIWPRLLGKVLKGQWPSTSAATVLTQVADLVNTVRTFRNRVMHYEPIWKRFGVTTEVDAIAHLREKIDKVVELIELISPEKLRLLKTKGLVASANRACSSSEIRRFQHLGSEYRIKSIGRLARVAESCRLNQEIARIRIAKGGKQRFLISPV